MKTHPTKATSHKEFYLAKNCHLEMQIKDIDSVGRTVCFIGNTLNYFDSDMDIIVPGAALKSITENGPNSNAPDKIRHAMFHDLTRSPGVIKTLEERKVDGLDVIYCETKIDNTTEGNDAMIKYLSGNYSQHSIGFQNVNYDYISSEAHGNSKEGEMWKELKDNCVNADELDSAGFCRVIKEIKLYEVSTVAFGANKLTPTIGIKSENKDAIMFNYLAQIDKLQNTIKSGGIADSSKKTFEIQVLQLKQMLQEIFMQFGAKEFKKPETEEKGFDFDKLMAAMG